MYYHAAGKEKEQILARVKLPQHLQAKCLTLLFYCLKLTYSLTAFGETSMLSSWTGNEPCVEVQRYSISFSISRLRHLIFPREREIVDERNRKYTRQEYFSIFSLSVCSNPDVTDKISMMSHKTWESSQAQAVTRSWRYSRRLMQHLNFSVLVNGEC